MASKVLIKMPTVTFTSSQQQVVNTKGPELVAVGHATATALEGASGSSLVLPTMSADPLLRVSQLEQNIRFLHDQHQHMLGSLHNEIEVLRQRNRDLQFQLVFTKKNAIFGQQTSSESSPDEESAKSKPLPISPNKKCNTQNLQVEMLEKDLTDLKTSLNELSDKNTNLTKVLNEQSDLLDKAINKEGEYESRLDDADKLIKRLQQENDDQRQEITTLKAQLSDKDSPAVNRPPSGGSGPNKRSGPGGGGSAGGSGRDRTNGNSGRDSAASGAVPHQDGARHHPQQTQQPQQQHGHHRFPPLHSQQQYRQRSPRQQNPENAAGRPQSGGMMNNRNNGGESAVLPHLQQQQQRHYNNYNSGQQNKPNRYYNNGGARHYNHNQQHYYYNNYKGGNNRSGNNSRDQQADKQRQQYEQHKPDDEH